MISTKLDRPWQSRCAYLLPETFFTSSMLHPVMIDAWKTAKGTAMPSHPYRNDRIFDSNSKLALDAADLFWFGFQEVLEISTHQSPLSTRWLSQRRLLSLHTRPLCCG